MSYHYTESGLPNVYIAGLRPMTDDDGDEVITINFVNLLHREIARGIVSHEKGMSPDELRFLRTEMGITQSELAAMVHRDKQSIGRWERGECSIEGSAETVIRGIAIDRLGLDQVEGGIEQLAKSSVPTAEIQPIHINAVEGGYNLAA